ncbi:hypothetical protein DACRYDRAFT_118670 [Dacryopinax primogenitus]|uniref:F-box domain-containing protein n=1 Tax=Dacryopinax primogenitus (strain DJM 731) TaxID=1858805 RepID=M5FPA8_DACPD|nr:uncharacterized protein DACRYDRAFT_118670 [Dacryopinax primogenitus]EJT98385.1 hypothetical protein DACRYDRAFT_118670 [Dacryopinax primogenitus]
MSMITLPVEILLAICHELEAYELCSLSRTCRKLHELIEGLAWKDYLLRHPRSSITHRINSSPQQQAAYNHAVDHSWHSRSYVACAFSEAWHRVGPALALTSNRLAVGAGEQIHLFPVLGNSHSGQLESPLTHRIHARDARRDVTAIAFLPDGEQGRTLLIGRADGLVQRYHLSPDERTLHATARYDHPTSCVLSLSVVNDTAVTAARNGVVSFIPTCSPWIQPSTLQVHSKPWSVHFSPDRNMLAVGTIGQHPLNVYFVLPSGPLSSHRRAVLSGPARASAVYGITHAPSGSIWGSSSSQVFVSGWFDGKTRVHDMRQKDRTACLSLSDPWDDSPVYAVAAGGGGSCHIAAGSSRHGIVRLWDVRQPKAGWSAFSPGKDNSPVYSLVMESSRVFGVTESRAFVMDFDPSARPSDYPPTPIAMKNAVRENDQSLLGEWTPHYLHCMTKIDISRQPARRERRLA